VKLRPEVLRFRREDGGLDLVDLLFDRLISLTADETAALEAGAADLAPRLEALFLVESEIVESMRRAAWASRARGRPATSTATRLGPVDWQEARGLPSLVADAWREPERLRRLAEERAAGRRYLTLPGFLAPDAAARLASAAAALPYQRMDTELVHAERRLLDGDELGEWRALLLLPSLRRLFGAVLGAELPPTLVANSWRLVAGDYFAVHPDGRLYRGTISLGLCDGWTAADGGAIAFGDPTAAGLDVRERWLPHAGDVCLFAPDRATFHAVEPVRSTRTRLSVTGWWTAPA
jgi:hypothetical protein